MKNWKAEIIAIGDEMISGARLDTNSQWLAQQLGDMGIESRFHSTIGDDLGDGVLAFQTAVRRADLVISTGGIGPTKDDLTRQVLADVGAVPLEFHPETVDHIRNIYTKMNRAMPASNQHQAWFPQGSSIIPNAEGTAPGIDLTLESPSGPSRIFALPGVPYEMKEMWAGHVRPAIQDLTGYRQVIKQHVVHCFGAGESQIETLLDDLTERDHNPRVGITASQATISLRIMVTGVDDLDCLNQIRPTLALIHERLGNLVFGENGVELQDVLVQMLIDRCESISLVDYGFGGIAGQTIFDSDQDRRVCRTTLALAEPALLPWLGPSDDVVGDAARKIRLDAQTSIGVAVSKPITSESEYHRCYQVAIADAGQVTRYTLHYGGHSGLRRSRTTKQILNQIRLHLLQQPINDTAG